jgi:hypothetical protein
LGFAAPALQGPPQEPLLPLPDQVGPDGLLEGHDQPGPDRLDDPRGAALLPGHRVVQVALADRVDEGDRAAPGHGGDPPGDQVPAHDQTPGVWGPPMNLCGEKKTASLWSPAPGALAAIRMGR